MTISFNEITDLRIPFVRVEYDNTKAVAGPANQPYKGLILGQKTSGGSATVNTLQTVTSAAVAKNLFGAGSMLHNIAEIYFEDPTITDLTMIAVAEPSGAASAGNVAFSGTATASGLINLYIGGRKVTATVAIGDDGSDIASALTSAIGADTTLPVTAAVDGDEDTQVNITCKQVGLTGDDIRLEFNIKSGDATPAGITPSVTAMSSGAGAPTLTSAVAAMGDTHYNCILNPWLDSTTLTTLETELDSRGSAARQIEAMAFSATADTLSTANTLGNSRNNKFLSITNIEGCPNPGYEIAAAIMKQVMIHGSIDPARPFQTLELKGIQAPAVTSRLTAPERESHLNNGIATASITSDGKVLIERLITTYKTNGAGAADVSYLDVNTLLTLSYIRYDFRNSLYLKFPRHKLANTTDRIAAGQAVLTPKIGKAHAITKFKSWEEKVLVEDIDQFKEELIVERNTSNPNRLDFLLPVNLVNQFLQAGVQIGFIL